jgi:hypothetical protein
VTYLAFEQKYGGPSDTGNRSGAVHGYGHP